MNRKTYKRETGVVMLLFLGGMFVWGAQGNAIALDAAKYLSLPVFSFAGLAFGMDAYSKQIK